MHHIDVQFILFLPTHLLFSTHPFHHLYLIIIIIILLLFIYLFVYLFLFLSLYTCTIFSSSLHPQLLFFFIFSLPQILIFESVFVLFISAPFVSFLLRFSLWKGTRRVFECLLFYFYFYFYFYFLFVFFPIFFHLCAVSFTLSSSIGMHIILFSFISLSSVSLLIHNSAFFLLFFSFVFFQLILSSVVSSTI